MKCALCKRFLRPGLFDAYSLICNACTRKQQIAKSTMTRARGYERSVNNTFVTRRIVAGSHAVDAAVHLRSISREIADTLREGL